MTKTEIEEAQACFGRDGGRLLAWAQLRYEIDAMVRALRAADAVLDSKVKRPHLLAAGGYACGVIGTIWCVPEAWQDKPVPLRREQDGTLRTKTYGELEAIAYAARKTLAELSPADRFTDNGERHFPCNRVLKVRPRAVDTGAGVGGDFDTF
ncbi:MAG: hypothetical protein ACI4RT_01780 [Candidatus Spyradenecus sp.]